MSNPETKSQLAGQPGYQRQGHGWLFGGWNYPRSRALLGLLIFAVTGVCARASERQIGFIQQRPGSFVLVSVVQQGEKNVVMVHSVEREGGKKEKGRAITGKEFDEIWAAFTGPEASSYVFSPGRSDSMADPRFYTVQILEAKKVLSSLRIPTGAETPGKVSAAVRKFKAWINEKPGE